MYAQLIDYWVVKLWAVVQVFVWVLAWIFTRNFLQLVLASSLLSIFCTVCSVCDRLR